MNLKHRLNYPFLIVTAILLLFGFLFLYALSATESLETFGNANYYALRQLKNLLPGIFLAIAVFFIPIFIIKKSAPYLLLLNLILLLLVFIPFLGPEFWGAKRWIVLWGFVLQPSEILKITSVLYLSAWISGKKQEKNRGSFVSFTKIGFHNFKYVFFPFIFFLGLLSIILIKQPDITTLGIIILTLVALYFYAKMPLWHLFLIVLAGTVSVVVLIKMASYRLQRLLVFFHPETDPLGIGFQIKQSLIAIGSGGIFGKGIGMSSQKFGFLPQAMTDSVFAVLAEESGITGPSILIILFLLFLWFGMKIAKNASDKFSHLAAFGVVFWIVLQAFVNISSTMGIFPVSGVPLPFFSYGGSHLLTELIGIGLLLNISKNR